jgi:hypothetical protein
MRQAAVAAFRGSRRSMPLGEIRSTIERRPMCVAYGVGPEAAMDVRGRVLVWRTVVLLRRANHRRRAALKHELAAYSTAAELADLEAIVDRYPAAQTREVRSFLVAQRLHTTRTTGTTWSHLRQVG